AAAAAGPAGADADRPGAWAASGQGDRRLGDLPGLWRLPVERGRKVWPVGLPPAVTLAVILAVILAVALPRACPRYVRHLFCRTAQTALSRGNKRPYQLRDHRCPTPQPAPSRRASRNSF